MRFLCMVIVLSWACGDDDRPPTPDAGADVSVDVGLDDASEDALADAPADASVCGTCEEPTPLCDESTMSCVRCLGDGDCDGLTCSLGMCVGCTETEQCTSPSASVCSPAGECVSCVSDSGCVHLDGACVAGTCEPHLPPCSPCTESPECGPNGACVPMNFRGTMLTGSWCVRRAPAVGDCEGAPFGTRIRGRASVDRTRVGDWCGPDENQTSCEAVVDAIGSDVCGSDDDCGVAEVADGICRGTCSYECSEDVDCPVGESCSEDERGFFFCQ